VYVRAAGHAARALPGFRRPRARRHGRGRLFYGCCRNPDWLAWRRPGAILPPEAAGRQM